MPTPPAHALTVSFYLTKLERGLVAGVAALCATLIIGMAVRSFSWRISDDVGFFHYVSWLVNLHGFVPYIDLHETSFPGSFVLYGLLARLGGYTNVGFNSVNLASLVLCMLLLAQILRHLHARAALVGALLFGSGYLALPHALYLQRDYLVVPLILGAVAVMTSAPRVWRYFIAGALFAVAASIKPHAAIGAPFVVLWLVNGTNPARATPGQYGRAILTSVAGFVSVCCAFALWLMSTHSLDAFLRMATDYLPLYQRMNGIHLALSSGQRLQNAVDWVSGTALLHAPPMIAALACLWWNAAINPAQKRLAALLFNLWFVYLVYVGIAGKFWDYHTIPAHAFYAALLGVICVPWITTTLWQHSLRVISVVCLLFWLWATFSWDIAFQQAACGLGVPRDDCAIEEADQYLAEDQLAAFLEHKLRPGERVEPMATSTVGPLFPALLRARVLPATPYLEGFPLYHDADTRYVQAIRADMLARLKATPPRFIIQPVNFFAPGGDAADRFVALDNYMTQHYRAVLDPALPGSTYFTVLERITP